jgi:adenylate cyclase class IV
MSKQLSNFTEFETKYRVQESSLKTFKSLMNTISYSKFFYIEGKDFYFTKNSEEFIRLRVPNSVDDFSELTIKKKVQKSNNIERFEVNLKLFKGEKDSAVTFIEAAGYEFNFSIWKGCHIYHVENAVISFYSVESDSGDWQTFFEIEVVPEITDESKAWEVIKKYESVFSELGTSAQKRLRKSLFEMYKKEGLPNAD